MLIDIGLVDSLALPHTLLDGCYLKSIFLEASAVNASVSKVVDAEPVSNSSENGPKPLKFSRTGPGSRGMAHSLKGS